MDLTPMTELDAVNLMLSVIGESPVNSLSVSGLADVAVAQQILEETSREVQEKGWTFNTEDRVTLPFTAGGEINIPSNALRIKLDEGYDGSLTQRGSRMYDRENHTYVFDTTRTLAFQITYMLAFEELPQAARSYIAIAAARKFQKRAISSDQLEKFTAEDEAQAKAQLLDMDTDAGDYNLIYDSWDTARIVVR